MPRNDQLILSYYATRSLPLARGDEAHYNEDIGDTGPIATKVRVKAREWLAGHRLNFLYLMRCGMVESVPSRRILSCS
jgi:hypothetical protein